MVFLAGALGCVGLGPWVIRRLAVLRWRQPLRHNDCPPLQGWQQPKQGTPTMGGLLVLGVATTVAIAFGGLVRAEGWWVLGAALALGTLGFADDLLKLTRPNANGLHVRPKLIAALGLGAAIGSLSADPALGYRTLVIPWGGTAVDPGWWGWVALAAVVVGGCAHAVNLTDGMDGLAAGCLALAFGVLGVVGAARGDALVAVWGLSLAGACVGFLWFNAAPASVFMGDVGALGLGAALGVLALLAHAALGLMILGGVFVVEAASVMLQVASYRWRHHRRIFRVAPLHHHFQVAGLAEPKVVVRFWIIGVVLAALGLSALG